MPSTTVLTESKYVKLVGDIRRLIEEGKARAAAAVSQELVTTYWEIGKRLTDEDLSSSAGYAEAILKDVAEELDIDYTTLTRSIHFFNTYKVDPRVNFVKWSHYRVLLNIQSVEKRRWYEQLVSQEKLTRDQLVNAIKGEVFEQSRAAKGKKLRSAKLKRPTQATFVYKAFVDRVVDGDTLLLRIDLGFAVFKEQRIRLAGIDTPPIDEKGGREAYRYVRDELARVPFVMVKTNKIDIYGRYVGHIFYSLKEKDKNNIFSEGNYLNQELLNKGLARII